MLCINTAKSPSCLLPTLTDDSAVHQCALALACHEDFFGLLPALVEPRAHYRGLSGRRILRSRSISRDKQLFQRRSRSIWGDPPDLGPLSTRMTKPHTNTRERETQASESRTDKQHSSWGLEVQSRAPTRRGPLLSAHRPQHGAHAPASASAAIHGPAAVAGHRPRAPRVQSI